MNVEQERRERKERYDDDVGNLNHSCASLYTISDIQTGGKHRLLGETQITARVSLPRFI